MELVVYTVRRNLGLQSALRAAPGQGIVIGGNGEV